VDRSLAHFLSDDELESVAVSLLFSFEDSEHEEQVASALEDTDLSYSLSSNVHAEIREYERTLVTSLNAALKPVMDTYLGNLKDGIEDYEIQSSIGIMQSNGGL
ncbi:MAG: hydantoinase/oxoprolinase family protein, partial [Halobacteria archaeon]|nr:hydantoinase/oxoprolinase family protein [Halobacteria archaeon]